MWGNRRKPFLSPARKSGLFLWLFQLLITEANILDPEMWPGPPSQAYRREMELSPRGGHVMPLARCQPRRGAHTACACSSARPTMMRKDVWGKGTRSGRGAPTVPLVSGLMPSGPGHGQHGPSPSPVLGPCCGNLAPPGEPPPAGLPDRLLSALSSLCRSQLLCTFRRPLGPLQGTPACTLGLHPLSAGAPSWQLWVVCSSPTLEPVSWLSCRSGLQTELS